MQTYEDAVNFIDHIEKYSAHPGVKNATKLLAALNHPERGLRIIHVAGTNGKGSVCAFLSDMLTALGYRTGLFISPHLVDIRERVQLDRKKIGKEDFTNCFLLVKRAAEELAREGYVGLTYFDYLFGIALCWYREQSPDYIVMETGLGGRLDSTNSILTPLLTIITSISLDHTEILGDTLAKIAAEKAGIIKPGVPLIYCADEAEACEVITKTAKENKSPYIGIGRKNCRWIPNESADAELSIEEDMAQGNVQTPTNPLKFIFSLPKAQCYAPTEISNGEDTVSGNALREILTVNSPALYQMENAAIAYTAVLWVSWLSDNSSCDSKTPCNILLNSLPEVTRTIGKNALARSAWEGRFEQIMPGVYLDGAHNADGIHMLLSSLRPLAKERNILLLFTAVKEKDTGEMIRKLCESGLFCRYLITTMGGTRAIPPEQLKENFQEHTNALITTYKTPRDAFFAGLKLKGENDILLCAGSLYLVGQIKEMLPFASDGESRL